MAARKEEINTSLPKVGPSQRRFSRLKILFTLLPYCLSLSILSFDFSFSLLLSLILGFPWWLRWLKICLQFRRPEFNPWVRKIPRRRKWQPTPVFLPGKSHGQRSLEGYSSWGLKELDTTEQQTLSGSIKNLASRPRGFPGSSAGKESACNAGEPWFDSWVGKSPWRRDRLPTPVFLPGVSPGTEEPGRLKSHGVIITQTQLSD